MNTSGERATRATVPHGAQGLLFGEDLTEQDATTGYRGTTACHIAGITYRQLDYWARTGLVEPSIKPATGSGTHRLYSFRDILVLKVVKRLLDTGVSLQQIRTAVTALRERGVEDLAQMPTETLEPGESDDVPEVEGDELAQRRAARSAV